MNSQHDEIHPNKTIRHKEFGKSIQLNVRGTSNKRIGQYLRKCLGLSIIIAATSSASAAPGDPAVDAGASVCTLTTDRVAARLDFLGTINGASLATRGRERLLSSTRIFDSISNRGSGSTLTYLFRIFSNSAPAAGFFTPETVSGSEPDIMAGGPATQVFVTYGASPNNEVCTYSYDLTFDGTTYTRSNYAYVPLSAPVTTPTNPTAVPLFTPIGLIATIGGLLWFGRRRKTMKVTQR